MTSHLGNSDSPEGTNRRVRVIGPPTFSVGAIIADVWTLFQYADLLYILTLFRLKVRYKQSVLGWFWAALQPVALMVIYTFVFAHVTKVRTDGIAYPAFVFTGLLPWILFSGSIANAVQGIVAYPTLLTKMYFPREIIPLSYLTASVIDFLIASVILVGILAHYRVAPTWNLLYVAPILAVLVGFAGAVAILFAAVHVRFRDIGLALPFLLQIWLFATPVVYSIQAVPERVRSLYSLDPVASAIDMFRSVVLFGHAPDLSRLGLMCGLTLIFLLPSYAYFKSSEAAMADLV
ncbi:MAG TPA: ABC transporter permease [Candidatus Sulfotelmatobacter sp.]|nr:ABC transporter permease [Candidatus Sulfotelmatobacter sp.]HLM82258.1 ABC transporter permease [Terriglobales bacterium]